MVREPHFEIACGIEPTPMIMMKLDGFMRGSRAFGAAIPAHPQPWLDPIERSGREFRLELTHCELFVSLEVLLQAAQAFVDCYNHGPQRVLSIIGAHAAYPSWLYLDLYQRVLLFQSNPDEDGTGE
jgi:hypothetical protein